MVKKDQDVKRRPPDYFGSFGNRTSPSDNSNDRWKRLCLVSWATAPCVSER